MKHRSGPPWKKKVADCRICGRRGIAARTIKGHQLPGFHYAPCGLPCAGGPAVIEEDRPHGVHSVAEACPACSAIGAP